VKFFVKFSHLKWNTHLKVIFVLKANFYVENSVFITAFVLQEAWSPMIILDPEPTYQLILDLDTDPERQKFWILKDPDPQHYLFT